MQRLSKKFKNIFKKNMIQFIKGEKMKYGFIDGVRINDVSAEGIIFPDALFRFFQEAAIRHSDSIGYNHSKYLDGNRVWVLNRLAYKLYEPIRLYELLKIETWSRGMQRFRGYRDFVLTVNDRRVGTASSVWLYIDIERKRPVKLDDAMTEAYQPEDEHVSGTEVEDWSPEVPADNARVYKLQTRYMDFDINADLNNTLYPAYVYQAFTELYGKTDGFCEFAVEYSHEIQLGVKEVDIRIEEKGGEFLFAVASGGANNAVGRFRV